MSNAIIRQGERSVVADNVWSFQAGAVPLAVGLVAGAALGRAWQARLGRVDKPATPRDWPIAFIHRGGAAVVPEDTIAGFTEGLRYGDGVVECDVHATLDGEIVVMHDEHVDRTTDGTGPIALKTLAEVKQLDAGYHFPFPGAAAHPFRGQGIQVPTLAEVYAAFPDRPVNIEIKRGTRPDVAELVAEVIRAAGAEKRTLVVSQSRATTRRFRQASHGEVATGSCTLELLGWWMLSLARLTRLVEPRFQALQPPETYRGLRVVRPGFVQAAHEQDLRVDVWTVDDEESMRRLLSWGVDGLMTDRPDVLGKLLGTAP